MAIFHNECDWRSYLRKISGTFTGNRIARYIPSIATPNVSIPEFKRVRVGDSGTEGQHKRRVGDLTAAIKMALMALEGLYGETMGLGDTKIFRVCERRTAGFREF